MIFFPDTLTFSFTLFLNGEMHIVLATYLGIKTSVLVISTIITDSDGDRKRLRRVGDGYLGFCIQPRMQCSINVH